jgi:serine/threonine-protein kinase
MQFPGYRQVARLGVGAKSVIYLVSKDDTGEFFALKQVDRAGPEDDRFIEQAENEFAVSSHVRHPALRRSLEIRRVRKWWQLRRLLILMEHVQGKTLEEDRPKEIDKILDIFQRVAEGLEALHQQGWVHADIKPNNIILTPDDHLKLIDFGQSCKIGTVKARIQGTPDYIAPEQAHRRPIDRRTDVFNLGATIYWVLTGRPYPTVLPGKGTMDIARPKDAKLPHEYNPRVPVAMSTLVMDCCKKRPQDRPDDMRQVAARIDVIRKILEREQQNGGASSPDTPGA